MPVRSLQISIPRGAEVNPFAVVLFSMLMGSGCRSKLFQEAINCDCRILVVSTENPESRVRPTRTGGTVNSDYLVLLAPVYKSILSSRRIDQLTMSTVVSRCAVPVIDIVDPVVRSQCKPL